MKGIILAAGRGSRMGDMTDARPKCLVELRGQSLLTWQLQAMRTAGLRDIGIVTGYRREMLSDYGLAEFFNPRWAHTNMVSSLTCAQAWLREQPCIVSYSDLFYEPAAIEILMRSDADLAVTYDPNWRTLWEKRFDDPLVDAETFRLGQGGLLQEIGRRPQSIEQVQGQYMGLLRFTSVGWAEIVRLRDQLDPAQRDRMHMTETLQQVITAGRVPVRALPYTGKWGEVDSARDLAAYHDL